jgi:hypothetical protein
VGVYVSVCAAAIAVGAGTKYLEDKMTKEELDVGQCYILNEEVEFGLKYSYVHFIHRHGKKNMYLAEQWDAAKGWYGFSSIRPFTPHDYTKVQCPGVLKGSNL